MRIKHIASFVSLTGRVDNQVAESPAETSTEYPKLSGSHKDIPEIEVYEDTFSINVKNDEKEVVYKNDAEVFEYLKVPSLASALKLNGATLTDDQMQFLAEALKGSEETGKAVDAIVGLINEDLRVSAKNNAYQRVFNAHKPLTEENIDNATASIVRNFMKLNNVSDETALTTLQGYGVISKEYQLSDFRGNRGKR